MRISNVSSPARSPLIALLLAVFVSLGAAYGQQRGVIRGVVRDLDGAPLPGVKVTAASARGESAETPPFSVHTEEDGTYIVRPLIGTFDVRAELPGFCGAEHRRIRVEPGAARTVDFTLRLSPVTNVLWITRSLSDLVANSDVVVHLRIVRSHAPRLLIPDILCGDGNVFTEHEVDTVAAVKADHASWPDGGRAMFVQNRAGVYTDGQTRISGPKRLYAAGEEYVAFLRWIPERGRFVSSGAPNLMVPVRDGRIAWTGGREPGVRDGMPVEGFLAYLRSLRD